MSGQESRDAVFATCEAAVGHVAPGVVALLRADGAELYHEAHGRRASVNAGGQAGDWVDAALQRDDIFDLASLTKVLCTTILSAQLVQEGAFALDQPLPSPCNRPYAQTTLAEILGHCSGFAAHEPFYKDYAWPSAQSRESLLHRVLEAPPVYPARAKAVYSDLGFITLGAAIESHYGQRLDQVFEDRIARPLGLDQQDARWVGFLPLDTPSASMPPGLDPRVIPCEVYKDPEGPDPAPGDYQTLRHRWAGEECWARGQVHDDNAYCMLGVAGHAGLFGTAAGVAEIAQAWLDGDPLGLEREVIERFERALPGVLEPHTRRLGWDGVAPDGPLASNAICHLGYTGTGLWIEGGGSQAIYVLLTHRVHEGRGDAAGIRELRRTFCERAKAWVCQVAPRPPQV